MLGIQRGSLVLTVGSGVAQKLVGSGGLLYGGVLNGVGGNASLWIYNSATSNVTSPAKSVVGKVFAGRERSQLIPGTAGLTSGLTASLSGTGATATFVFKIHA